MPLFVFSSVPFRALLASCLVVAFAFVGTRAASAADFTVTKTADTRDGACNADCSLREAIDAANLTPDADTIILGAGTYRIERQGTGEDANDTGDFDILQPVTIRGQGALSTIVNATSRDRAFDLHADGLVRFENLTVREGETTEDGGAIYVRSLAQLTLVESVVRNSKSTGGGGGGIYIQVSATVLIQRSAIINNTATSTGGGILNNNQLIVENSTISGNDSSGTIGGGIYNNGDTTLRNATIAFNTSGQGGAFYNPIGSTLVTQNSIIASNTPDDCRGDASSNGNNLIGNSTGCTMSTTASDLLDVNPRLQALRVDGGQTPVHPLAFNSPAIDAGYPGPPAQSSNSCLAVDQRGKQRPFDGNLDGTARCDIGAFELYRYQIYLPVTRAE
jgi:CSLREA domain-containing protein